MGTLRTSDLPKILHLLMDSNPGLSWCGCRIEALDPSGESLGSGWSDGVLETVLRHTEVRGAGPGDLESSRTY